MTETTQTSQVAPTTADLFARFREVPAAVGNSDVFGPLRAAIQTSLDVHHMPIPDDASEWQREHLPPEEILDRLRERYAPVEVPPCRVCGEALSIQSMGGGHATVWAHSTPDGVRLGDWLDHYQDSKWIEVRSGDGEVIAIIDILQSLLDGPTAGASS